MKKTVSIPLTVLWEKKSIVRQDGGEVVFPDKCVYCGAPREKLKKDLRGTAKKQEKNKYFMAFYKPRVPYCKKHARQSFWNHFIMAFFVIGFAFAALTPAISVFRGKLKGNLLPFLGLVGWFIGASLIGFLGGAIVKELLTPIRKSLRDQSLLSLGLSPTAALGFSFILFNGAKPGEPEQFMVMATFVNEEYAAEFEKLNS